MIHQHIFASPKPGMTEEDFQRYWVEVHAVKYASKISQIKRYLIDTRIDWQGETSTPIWNGIAEIWLNNEKEQLESMQSKEFLQGARLDEPNWAAFWNTLVLDTDAYEILAGPPLVKNPGWVKLVSLIKRAPGTTVEHFRKHCLDVYAPLVLEIPGLRRHLQCHTRDSWYVVGEPKFDAIMQYWFDDVEALEKAVVSPEYKDRCMAVAEKYFDPKYIFSMASREHWIIGPDSRL